MVDMLSSFLSGLSGNKRRTSCSTQQNTSHSFSTGNDREEDGFLFLGNTTSENNTKDSTFQADSPPSYDLEIGLPSFSEVMEARQGNNAADYQPMSLPIPSVPLTQQCNTSTSARTDNSSHLPIAHDIPFQLARDVEIRLSGETDWFCVPVLPPMDHSRYQYDFTFERSVVQETSTLGTISTESDISLQGWTDIGSVYTGSRSQNSAQLSSRDSHHVNDLMSFD